MSTTRAHDNSSERSVKPDGEAVVNLRKTKGLTQEDLLRKLANIYESERRSGNSTITPIFSKRTISRVESGQPVYLRTLRSIATALEVPVECLVEMEVELDAPLRDDAALLRQHLVMFDRAVFWEPFLQEGSVMWMIEAIDDIITAINTGKLYTRSHNLVAEFPSKREYRTPRFRDAFLVIVDKLYEIKTLILSNRDKPHVKWGGFFWFGWASNDGGLRGGLVRASRAGAPGSPEWRTYVSSSEHFEYLRSEGVTVEMVEWFVGIADTIDKLRNEIINEINELLSISQMEPLQLQALRGRDKVVTSSEYLEEKSYWLEWAENKYGKGNTML